MIKVLFYWISDDAGKLNRIKFDSQSEYLEWHHDNQRVIELFSVKEVR